MGTRMGRIQSFEIHDLPQCPQFIRESVTESLGNALRWAHVYSGGAAELFVDFCEKAKSDSILDLCSGSGEPISILLERMEEQGFATPAVTLSDLYPNTVRMEEVVDRRYDSIKIHYDPVDATDVPDEIEHSARTMISAFHHFPPESAQSILRDSVEKNKAIFILEPLSGQLHHSLSITCTMIAATLANPVLTHRNRMKKALCTFASPIIPLVNAWDSFVSLLRMYREETLMGFVAPFGHRYHWEFRQIPVKWGGKVTTFYGYPVQREISFRSETQRPM